MSTSETPRDLLNQLADRAGRHAVDLERLSGENTALRGRVEALEGQLAALRELQQDLVGRLERAVARTGGQERLDALDERLAAGHAAGLKTAERVEAVAAEVAALGRLATGVERTRADVAQQLAEHRERTEQAVAQLDERLRRDREGSSRGVDQLEARVARLAEATERLDGLERGRRELGDSLHRLGARLDAEAAERAKIQEGLRTVQEHADQRIAQLAEVVREMQSSAAEWQERTQEQMAILRDARALADRMRGEAERLEQAQLTSARAQQAHEARTETRLATWRNDLDEEIVRFVARHDRERDQADREHLAREVLRDEAHAEARAELALRLDALEHDLRGRLAALVSEGLELRRRLGDWLVHERDGVQALLAELERGGQSEARPELADERRAALRRAMRAQRAEGSR